MKNQETVRVLIAEDDYLVSKMMEGLLEEIGYTVVGEARDGLEAGAFVVYGRGLLPRGAGDGIRTHGRLLGKQMRYHCATPARHCCAELIQFCIYYKQEPKESQV